MSYIENSFPTVQFEEYLDDNGNLRSKPVFDSEGNAVINREAARQKEELLDKLGSIKVPASALDMIINHFGSDMVAENTGRKRRVVVKDGKAKEENIAHKKQADVSAFQDGDKRIIVFSKAGGTGKSYHADKSAKNGQHRVHYLLQAGWQADAAVQGFGRSHRSNQVSAPTFSLVTTDLKGQMRFISTIAKRLDQLGALTKGQRQTGSQGLFTAGDNLENAFAADVLAMYYKALICNRVDGISDGVSIIEKLGLKDKLMDEYGHINTAAPELREVNKFLNRILAITANSEQLFALNGDTLLSRDTAINIPPRIRMTTLYAIAQSLPCGGRVANTCNFSENYIGYSTKFGDAAGDFSPLSDFLVCEVKQIGYALGLPDVFIEKIPSDGLCGATDEDNLGFSYDTLDRYIGDGICEDQAVREKIDSLHMRSLHKTRPMPHPHYVRF